MNKQYWSEEKIATSKSVAEATDEFERGCDLCLMHGRCNMKCSFCIMQRTYNDTIRFIATKTTNIVINGGNVTINIK